MSRLVSTVRLKRFSIWVFVFAEDRIAQRARDYGSLGSGIMRRLASKAAGQSEPGNWQDRPAKRARPASCRPRSRRRRVAVPREPTILHQQPPLPTSARPNEPARAIILATLRVLGNAIPTESHVLARSRQSEARTSVCGSTHVADPRRDDRHASSKM